MKIALFKLKIEQVQLFSAQQKAIIVGVVARKDKAILVKFKS